MCKNQALSLKLDSHDQQEATKNIISAPGIHGEHYFQYDSSTKSVKYTNDLEGVKDIKLSDDIDFLVSWLFHCYEESEKSNNELRLLIEDSKNIIKYKTIKEQLDWLLDHTKNSIDIVERELKKVGE